MPKWLFPLVIIFLLFVVYNDPATAGEFTRSFVGALGDLFSRVGEFLAALFGSDASSGDVANTTSPTLPSGTVADTVLSGEHTHVHTHPTPAP